MSITKPVGAFTGNVKFYSTTGEVSPDHLTNITMTSSDATIATVSIDAGAIISGTGLQPGNIVLYLTATNDQGGPVAASIAITFTGVVPIDTTATIAVIQID